MGKKLAEAAALTMAVALAACGEDAPVDKPVEGEGSAALLGAQDNATAGSTEAAGEPSGNSNSDRQLDSGSNDDESARKPDPKRSKLIKADPN